MSLGISSVVVSPEPSFTGGEQGPSGVNGLSAYQIAVINGFVGTESQWITSIGAGDSVSKSGDTMTGKLVVAADATASKLNIGNAITGIANPITTIDGDIWINNSNQITYKSNSVVYNLATASSTLDGGSW